MLAQSELEEDKQRIREEIAIVAKLGTTTRAAAWTAAYIEIDDLKAIDHLRTLYCGKSTRSQEERKAVYTALSTHGSEGDPSLRTPIVSLYRDLLGLDATLAPSIASDAKKWGRMDLAPVIAALLKDRSNDFDLRETSILRGYLEAANTEILTANVREAVKNPPKDQAGTPLWTIIALLILILMLAARRGFAGRERN